MALATRIKDGLRWLGRHELGILASLAVVAMSIWVFAEVADEMLEGATRRFDEWVLLAMRAPGDPADPIGPRWFEEIARDVTALGGITVLALLTLGVIGYLLLLDKVRTAVFIAIAVSSAELMSTLLKLGFDRPRPDLVPHHSYVYTSSFPSGHAMLSVAVYLTLAALLARIQPRLVLKAYLLMGAVIIATAVGMSRIYLGVHWPTDVVAGWAAGAAWAALAWLAVRGVEKWRGSDSGSVPDARSSSGSSSITAQQSQNTSHDP